MACASARAVPKNALDQQPKVESRVERAERRAEPACPTQRFELEKDEKIIGSICRGNVEFVLTDRHLYTYFADGQPMSWGEGIEVRGSYTSKMEAGEVLAPGLAAWDATEKYCYILTKDGVLNMIPNKNKEPYYPVFRMPFPATYISKGKMLFYSGFLFIAGPYGDSFVIDESTRENRMFSLPPVRDAAFFTRGGKLFYGINGWEDVEIRVIRPSLTEEASINDIRVIIKE